MAYSYQSVVSNGTLTNLLLTINYLSRDEISVYFNGALSTAWSWVGTTEKQITFSPAVPNGTTVLVRRSTMLQAPKHLFSTGAQFKAQAVDENTTQLLNAAQEAQEFRNNPAFQPGSVVNTEDGSLAFMANGAEKMRLAASGQLGIGRTPACAVDIGDDSGQQLLRLNGAGSGSGSGAAVYLKAGGTLNAVGNHSAIAGGAYDADFTVWAGAGSTRFYTGGAERVRIDTAGNVGIGDTNPAGWNSKLLVKGLSGAVQSTTLCSGSSPEDSAAVVAAAANSLYSASVTAYGNGAANVHLNGAAGKGRSVAMLSSNLLRWSLGASSDTESGSNSGSDFFIARYADNGAYIGAPLKIYRTTGDAFFEGAVVNAFDNTKTLGGAGYRWSTVYAGTGTINTSDAREKTTVRELTSAEIQAAQALAKEIGAYKFLAAVAEKGAAAREHIGMTVQRAIELLESFGLDPFTYGFICYDEWDQTTELIPGVGDVPEEFRVVREAGNRYSFRMDELLAFIIRGVIASISEQDARLRALEARLTR